MEKKANWKIKDIDGHTPRDLASNMYREGDKFGKDVLEILNPYGIKIPRNSTFIENKEEFLTAIDDENPGEVTRLSKKVSGSNHRQGSYVVETERIEGLHRAASHGSASTSFYFMIN